MDKDEDTQTADTQQDDKQRDFDAMFADHRKRTTRDVQSAIESRLKGVVTVDILTEALEPFKALLNRDVQPDDQAEEDSQEKGYETEDSVKLKKLSDMFEARNKELDELKDQLAKEKQQAKQSEDFRFVEELLSKNGVPTHLVGQARTLYLGENPIVHDDQKGRLHEVKGQYGPEFKEPSEVAVEWLGNNQHFLAEKKTGSGATNDSSGELRAMNIEKYVNDPASYMEDRDKVHNQLESKRGT